MNAAIYFDDNTCPRCGKDKLQSNNLHSSKQLSTIDTYICKECKLQFPVEWKSNNDNTSYTPAPLYNVSKIEEFKSYFREEEKTK